MNTTIRSYELECVRVRGQYDSIRSAGSHLRDGLHPFLDIVGVIIDVVGEVVHLVDDAKLPRLEVLPQHQLNDIWRKVVNTNAFQEEVEDEGRSVGYMRLLGHRILRV